MSEIFLKVLNMSIVASYIIAAAVIIRVSFKKLPKWIICLMWGMAAIRLVLPFSIKSNMSLIPRINTVTPDIIQGYSPIASNPGEIGEAVNHLNPMSNPQISSAGAVSSDLLSIISIIWLSGIVMLMAYGILSYILLKKKVKGSELLGANSYISKNIASPFILGIIKPRIYMPYGVDPNDIPHIIAHENTHIRRKDHWIKPFGYLLLAIYWFNPFVWIAYILLCRDIELACDEAVIKKLGEKQKKSYSNALLSCSMGRRRIAACPLAFGEIGVKERIKNVLDYRKPAVWVIAIAIALSTVLAIVFLTNPKDGSNIDFPAGTYAFDEVIYMNPLSSYYPFAGTGELYELADNKLTITNMRSGEIISEINFNPPESSSFKNREWEELFVFDFAWVDMSSVDKDNRTFWELSEDYRVYMINDELWLMRISGTNGAWSIYKLRPYDESVDLTEDSNPEYWDEIINSETSDSLDKIIPHLIYNANNNEYSKGDYATQAYSILHKEETEDEMVLYLMAMYLEFNNEDGRLVEHSGVHSPVVITLEKADNGGYGLTEYWTPGEGAEYMTSLKKKFPDGFDEESLSTQKYVKAHLQACYDSAVKQSGVDASARIENLLEILSKSPAQSSNPYAYIQEHETEYRELIYYGNYTLQYCFNLFEAGGQTGLEGYLMALVCNEILDIEPSGKEFEYTNGQEWYDKYIAS